ncbi:MAG: histidine phosphatase family protein [Chthoniobacterales bacterium]
MKRSSLTILLLLGCGLQLLPAQSTTFLVRHAEKADVGAGDPKDPALSAVGRARAESLADILKDAGITAVFATEFQRTRQTAEPLAQAAKLQVTTVPAADSAELVAQLKNTRGNALVVAHSNTLPEILQALGTPLSVVLTENDYDNLFIFTTGTPPHLTRLHLPAPPAPVER